ncbi:MAG: efflux transporter outer membrane subunit [Flavobacteriales bacterium]|nr:efflux transporter outer membrane subunit [Flavobacteriales bacterium]
MILKDHKLLFTMVSIAMVCFGCSSTALVKRTENRTVPASYSGSTDSTNTSSVKWKAYFNDPYLNVLIDSALSNNQELNIMLQEIRTAQYEVKARKGEYLPFIGALGSAEVDKVGRYTSKGSSEATTDIMPDVETPEPLPDYMIGLYAKWEVDVWGKLRNAKKAAYCRYLGTVEGKNFMVTNLVAEISNSYYELLALDNQLLIVQQNIEIQSGALSIVRQQKQATRVTELAVRRFEAEVFHTRSMQFEIQQQITEMENHLNFLVGRFPGPIQRNAQTFSSLKPDTVLAGLPAQLLANRPDIRQAEQELTATKLDVKSARARFYPSVGLSAGVGFRAFDPEYLFTTPQSLIFNVAGDLVAPLINRNAIKAAYYTANAKQVQAVYDYERTILNAYVEVANQVSNIGNLNKSYALRAQRVQALQESITISNSLFLSARADYMEVLLTQRDALDSRFELVETQKLRLNAKVNVYRALGGGWR